jgi:putative oxidoreductase
VLTPGRTVGIPRPRRAQEALVSTAIDLGMLVIRLALGPMLILHGYNKLFGTGGLAGTTRWFEGLGLRPAWLHARLAPVNEIGAGLLMSLGLLTPLACAAFVGLMATATLTDHRGKGYFVFKGGWEYTLLVGIVAVGVAAIGPGDWSIDHALGWHLEGPLWALGSAVLGLVSAGLLLATSYRPVTESAATAD